MALQKTVIDLPVTGGLYQENDKFFPKPFEVLDNFWLRKTGALEKRPGFRPMSNLAVDGFPFTSNNLYGVVSSPDGELMVVGYKPAVYPYDQKYAGTFSWTYVGSSGRWAPKCTLPGFTIRRRPSIHIDDYPNGHPMHIAMCGDYEVAVVRVGSSKVFVRITDTNTGAILLDNAVLSTTQPPGYAGKIVPIYCGDGLVTFVYLDGTTTQLRRVTINPSSMSFSFADIGPPYSGLVAQWDVVPTVTGVFVVSALVTGAPGAIVTRRVNNATGAVLATATELNAGDAVSVGWSGGGRIAVCWDATGNVYTKEYVESSLATLTAAYIVMPLSSFLGSSVAKTVVGYDQENNVHSFVVAKNPDGYIGTWWRTYYPSAGGPSGITIIPYNTVHTKPFRLTDETLIGLSRVYEAGKFKPGESYGIAFLNLRRRQDYNNNLALQVEGLSSPIDGIGYEYAASSEHSANVMHHRAGVGVVPIPTIAALSIQENGVVDIETSRFGLSAATLSNEPYYWNGELFTASTASKLLHFPGGLPVQYDGATAVEIAFLEPPQAVPNRAYPSQTPGTVGPQGTATSPATYSYVACWEWLDSRGLIHRSRPSDPVEVTVAVASPNTAAIVHLRWTPTALTRRGNRDEVAGSTPRLAVYRTLANGTVYYRLRWNNKVNKPQDWEIEFDDEENDQQVLDSGRGVLYTSGGVVENYTPPPARHIQVSAGRVWITSGELPEVWPSKYLVSGEAPSFNPLLRITLDDAQTPLVGTASLGDLLAIFSESRIYTVPSGAGPGDNASGGWPPPEEVHGSAGCVSAASILSYQDGVLYRDREGFQLLTRSRQIEFIGAAVRDLSDRYPYTLDTVLDEANSRIYILVSSGTTQPTQDGSVIIVWDYGHRAWSTISTYLWEEDEEIVQIPWLYSRISLWRDTMSLVYGSRPFLLGGLGADTAPGYDRLQEIHGDSWVRGTIETPWLSLARLLGGGRPGAPGGGLGSYQRLWRVALELERLSPHGLRVSFFKDGSTTANQQVVWTPAEIDDLIGLPRERLLIGVADQKSATVKIRVEDTPPTETASAKVTGFRYHTVSLEIGQKVNMEKAEKPNTR